RSAQHADCRVVVHVILGKSSATLKVPFADFKILGTHAAILRAPVQVAVNRLDAAIHVWRSALDAGDLVQDGLGIADHQGLDAARADADPVTRPAAGFHPNQVVADFAELVLHAAGAGFAHADHANERPDTHDDPQHG